MIPPSPNATLTKKMATVDLTLKVKEKGKNSIGLTGGVSGLAGSFIGINYATNNFLGLGETLSVQINLGDRQRDFVFGFSEPYLFERPLNLGFQVYTRRFNYDQARETSIITGQQLNLPSALLQSLQNYTQSSKGFSVSASYPLRRSFKRLGISYSYDDSSIIAVSDASKSCLPTWRSAESAGRTLWKASSPAESFPASRSIRWTPPTIPTSGTSFSLAGEFAGIGGTVRSVRPVISVKHFFPMQNGHNAIAANFQGSFITGYGGVVAPPFQRFYMGGEYDLRGFDIRSVSPVAYLPDQSAITLVNPGRFERSP